MGTAKKPRPTGTTTMPPSRRELRYQQRRAATRRKIIALISVVGVAAVIALIVVLAKGDPAPAYAGTSIQVDLSEYAITGNLTAPAGPVRLEATNIGGQRHNIGKRGGPISGDVQPGAKLTLDLGVLQPGTYELYCDLPQHVQQGMVNTLTVTPAPSVSTTP